jgi:hypothetical protein
LRDLLTAYHIRTHIGGFVLAFYLSFRLRWSFERRGEGGEGGREEGKNMTAERKETEHRNTRRDYHFERLLGEKLSRRQVEAWKLSSGVTQWMVEAMESSCEIEFELSHRVFGVRLSCDKVELEAGELSRGRL